MYQNRKAVLGAFLVILGTLFLLRAQNIFSWELERFIFSWPMLLIGLGAFNLIVGNRTPAIILLAVGAFFILDKVPWFHWNIDWEDFWPILLIVIGLAFIFRQGGRHGSAVSDNYFDAVNIFGGGNQIISSHKLEGGKITSIFGGSEIDLRESKPIDGAIIEIFTMFGGTDITVPADWNVRVEVTSILGGFEDKRRIGTIDESAPRVIIKGFTMFGGGEVKS